MTMPGDIAFFSNTSYFGANLTEAVRNGSVPMSRVDDMATRIVGGWFLVGQDQGFPAVNFDSFHVGGPNNSRINVQDNHRHLIRKIGAASTVLLKNVNNTLPLKAPYSIALIGSDAGPSSRGPNGYPDRGGNEGTLAMGWGSGTAQFPYLISPLEAIQARAIKDNTLVNWWLRDFDLPGAQAVAANAGVAMVFINSDSGEEYITVDGNVGDRNNLTAWHGGDNLVLAVANVTSNVVVVVHSVGALTIEPWIDHPNVTAVLWAGLPGECRDL
jgi:beta-glucosidase